MQGKKSGTASMTVSNQNKVELTPKLVIKLLQFTNQVFSYNQALPIRTAKWLSKNSKVLSDQYEKNSLDEKNIKSEFLEYANYVERHTNGKDLFWDKVEDNPEKEIVGVRAWVNDNGQLVNTANEKVLSEDMANNMEPYIKDEGQRAKYKEKHEEFKAALKAYDESISELQLLKISEDYLEQTNFVVPTTLQSKQGPLRLDLSVFYDYLVESKGEYPSQNGKMKVEKN